jgi:hypothetical protein
MQPRTIGTNTPLPWQPHWARLAFWRFEVAFPPVPAGSDRARDEGRIGGRIARGQARLSHVVRNSVRRAAHSSAVMA